MRNNVVFNGKPLSEFGVFVSGSGVFNAPERDVNIVEMDGRNGALVLDKGRYKNIELSYPAFIYQNFKDRVQGLRNYLNTQIGYVRLEDSYNPDEYRLARISSKFQAKPIEELTGGNFELTFDCYPQRFLKSGEQPITLTANGTIVNNELTTAKPLIRAYGTGSFSIGGVAIQITTASSYTDIDCDLQECYKDTLATNCNANVVLTNNKFPELVTGNNAVTLSGITKLIITPRWWIL